MSRFDIEQLLRELDETLGPQESPEDDVLTPTVSDVPSEPIRPPDFVSGEGLGEEIDPAMAINSATLRPTRPDDALRDLYVPGNDLPEEGVDLVDTLVSRGILDAEGAANVRRVLEQSPDRRAIDVIMDTGVEEADIQVVIAECARIPFLRVEPSHVDSDVVHQIGRDFCRERMVLPIRTEGSRAIIATASPDDVFLLDEVKRRLCVSVVKHVLVTVEDIKQVLDAIDRNLTEDVDVEAILADVEEDDVEVELEESESADLEAEAESSPVVRYVNHIIQTALKEGASDIHIEPGEKNLRVRMRIDGVFV